MPSSVLRLPRRTRFPLSRSAAMHRTPCTRSQPLCKYLPSIASRRRTDTLTPFVYTNSITSKAKIMLRRQRGYRSHKEPPKYERLFMFLSYHLHWEKSREKSDFYETKNIFSSRKKLLYTGARLSYILCYNIYFQFQQKKPCRIFITKSHYKETAGLLPNGLFIMLNALICLFIKKEL